MTIISYRHRFIFIKTVKTAGTSIEIDLSRRVEDEAVVTPITPSDDNHHPRNYCAQDGTVRYTNHMKANLIRDQIGGDRFAGFFKFCVEREPVEKCISQFHMLRNSPVHNQGGQYTLSWQDYCDAGKFPVELGKYSEMRNGQRHLLVDRVLRYERLKTDLPELLNSLGIPRFEFTSRAKSEYSRNALVSPEQVTASQRKKIYSAFKASLVVTGLY